MTMEPLITRLVQQAPELDARTIDELVAALERHGTPLALAIRRIVELVAEQLVDMAIALPALAEAIATLESSRDPKVLEAARYQIDTLEPVPDRPEPPAAPDVPIDLLRRPRGS